MSYGRDTSRTRQQSDQTRSLQDESRGEEEQDAEQRQRNARMTRAAEQQMAKAAASRSARPQQSSNDKQHGEKTTGGDTRRKAPTLSLTTDVRTKQSSSVPQPQIFLYCDKEDEFCIDLLAIIVDIPLLKNVITCRDVQRHPVPSQVDSIPTIEDPGSGGSAAGGGGRDMPGRYHKHQAAFNWVLSRCTTLVNDQQMSKSELSVVEQRINRVLRKFQTLQQQEQQPQQQHAGAPQRRSEDDRDDEGELLGDDQRPPSVTMYSSGHESEDLGASAKVPCQQQTKYLYKQYIEEHKKRPPPQGSIADRMKQLERDRQQLLNCLKSEWDKTGGAKASTHKEIKRSELKNTKLQASEMQIKDLEMQRQQMLQKYAVDGGDASGLREPLQRQSAKMGRSIPSSYSRQDEDG